MTNDEYPEEREHQFVVFTTEYTLYLVTVCGATRTEARMALPYVMSDTDYQQIGQPIPGLDIPEDEQYPFFLNSLDEKYAKSLRTMLKAHREGSAP